MRAGLLSPVWLLVHSQGYCLAGAAVARTRTRLQRSMWFAADVAFTGGIWASASAATSARQGCCSSRPLRAACWAASHHAHVGHSYRCNIVQGVKRIGSCVLCCPLLLLCRLLMAGASAAHRHRHAHRKSSKACLCGNALCALWWRLFVHACAVAVLLGPSREMAQHAAQLAI